MRKPSGKTIAAGILILAAAAALMLGLRRSPETLLSGKFHQAAHKGSGTARVCRFPDGNLALCLIGFRTYPGTDLEVRLIAAPDALENETVENSEFVSLGDLQTAEGDSFYRLPSDLDLNKYRAVTIWSRKYRVNFTTAPLIKP
ncbi:MAG: DM13 domain-containing protein [Acidobacteriota bacterium]